MKRRPRGPRQVFSCRLLSRNEEGVVLLYVLPSPGGVSGLQLAMGTRTVAYFWPAQPYNVYYWLTPAAQPVGWYFNIARDTVLHPHHVEWTDLGLDLLVLPGGQATWIDEEEGAALGPEDHEHAETARRRLEAVYPEVVSRVARETMALREVIGRA